MSDFASLSDDELVAHDLEALLEQVGVPHTSSFRQAANILCFLFSLRKFLSLYS